MTIARGEIVRVGEVGYYHCISRCVRRAFLCGKDSYSGKCFEHRKEWVRERLFLLLEVFAVEVASYSVMSNHLHTLLKIRPDIVKTWSPEDVARRWRALFPKKTKSGEVKELSSAELNKMIADKGRISELRTRLSSISWFNRCLNEHIARRSNKEDGCKGRFWEGRFKCQRIVDPGGLLACSAYIDLNPIRAGTASSLEKSDYTSLQDRIVQLVEPGATSEKKLKNLYRADKLIPIETMTEGKINTYQYVQLVEETGKAYVQGKASLAADIEPFLLRFNLLPENWIQVTEKFSTFFSHVVGTEEQIVEAAKKAEKKWFKGRKAAQKIFKHQ